MVIPSARAPLMNACSAPGRNPIFSYHRLITIVQGTWTILKNSHLLYPWTLIHNVQVILISSVSDREFAPPLCNYVLRPT